MLLVPYLTFVLVTDYNYIYVLSVTPPSEYQIKGKAKWKYIKKIFYLQDIDELLSLVELEVPSPSQSFAKDVENVCKDLYTKELFGGHADQLRSITESPEELKALVSILEPVRDLALICSSRDKGLRQFHKLVLEPHIVPLPVLRLISNRLCTALLSSRFDTRENLPTPDQTTECSAETADIIGHIVGYVIRKVGDEALRQLLTTREESAMTGTLTKVLDRGGLLHPTAAVVELFSEVDQLVLNSKDSSEFFLECNKLFDKFLDLVQGDQIKEDKSVLFNKLLKYYANIRMNARCKNVMDRIALKRKQTKKQNALRKKLCTT